MLGMSGMSRAEHPSITAAFFIITPDFNLRISNARARGSRETSALDQFEHHAAIARAEGILINHQQTNQTGGYFFNAGEGDGSGQGQETTPSRYQFQHRNVRDLDWASSGGRAVVYAAAVGHSNQNR